MNIDLLMVVLYFVIIFIIGIYKSADQKKDATNYFLSGRKLRWPSIAMSTIATNIQAGHFVGMGGAAYTYGLAQANFEIGAIFSILGAMETPSQQVITRGGTILWKDGQLTPQKDASEETEFATGMVFDLTGEGATSIYIAVAGLEGSLTEARKIYRETTSNPLSHSVESGNYYKKLLAKSVTIVSPDEEFNEGYRWALVGTDRHFLHTPSVGRGFVAGFAETIPGWGECPRYAWYFGRDSVWTCLAVLAYGDFKKVRDQLEVLGDFQDISGKFSTN
jgi:alkylated DNA nucleotide flippase Atl1